LPLTGLKVISVPSASTAVHWLVDGHDTPPLRISRPSIEAVLTTSPLVGLNVTSCPAKSTVVHWLPEGQETLINVPPSRSTPAEEDHETLASAAPGKPSRIKDAASAVKPAGLRRPFRATRRATDIRVDGVILGLLSVMYRSGFAL
jgi:hypothetical protein